MLETANVKIARSEANLIPIDSLRFGQDHPEFPINVRHTDREAGIAALMQSILVEGLLQPLLVWEDANSVYWVVDGSRRLTALRALNNEGRSFEYIACNVYSGGNAASMLAKSIAGFMSTLPPHPMDQFEAFEALRKTIPPLLDPVAEIAERFGVTGNLVRRRLKLGAMAPVIREAVRAGSVEMETAQAFTLLDDQEEQAKVFVRLKKTGLSPWAVRKAIMGENSAGAAAMLNFVGRKEYEEAGGHVLTDLFADTEGAEDGASDMALLHRLAREKIDVLLPAVLADGWSWASIVEDMPPNWAITHKRGDLKKTKATAEQKAATGVVLGLTADGKVRYEYGVGKPEPKQASAPKKTKSADKDEAVAPSPSLPRNIVASLQRQASLGLAGALRQSPHDVCLAALLAAIMADERQAPLSASIGGVQYRLTGDRGSAQPFDKFFRKLRKDGPTLVRKHLASIAGDAVDVLDSPSEGALPLQTAAAIALTESIAPKLLNEALREAFDYREYFNSVSKAFLLEAMREALPEKDYRRASDNGVLEASKDDLAQFCIRNIPKTGWLPAELRAISYNGPDAKKHKAR